MREKSNTPIDKFNHLIDAVGVYIAKQNPNRGKYAIR